MSFLDIRSVTKSNALCPDMTVGQSMTFGLQMHGVPRPERDRALADVSRLLQIESLLDRKPGQDILLGIRPEAVTDPEGADRKSGNIQSLTNRVTVTEPAGSDTFVTMTLSGRDIIARMRADAAVLAGATFDFAVNMDKAVVFDPATEARIA